MTINDLLAVIRQKSDLMTEIYAIAVAEYRENVQAQLVLRSIKRNLVEPIMRLVNTYNPEHDVAFGHAISDWGLNFKLILQDNLLDPDNREVTRFWDTLYRIFAEPIMSAYVEYRSQNIRGSKDYEKAANW